jgi:hypothetical protein
VTAVGDLSACLLLDGLVRGSAWIAGARALRTLGALSRNDVSTRRAAGTDGHNAIVVKSRLMKTKQMHREI